MYRAQVYWTLNINKEYGNTFSEYEADNSMSHIFTCAAATMSDFSSIGEDLLVGSMVPITL